MRSFNRNTSRYSNFGSRTFVCQWHGSKLSKINTHEHDKILRRFCTPKTESNARRRASARKKKDPNVSPIDAITKRAQVLAEAYKEKEKRVDLQKEKLRKQFLEGFRKTVEAVGKEYDEQMNDPMEEWLLEMMDQGYGDLINEGPATREMETAELIIDEILMNPTRYEEYYLPKKERVVRDAHRLLPREALGQAMKKVLIEQTKTRQEREEARKLQEKEAQRDMERRKEAMSEYKKLELEMIADLKRRKEEGKGWLKHDFAEDTTVDTANRFTRKGTPLYHMSRIACGFTLGFSLAEFLGIYLPANYPELYSMANFETTMAVAAAVMVACNSIVYFTNATHEYYHIIHVCSKSPWWRYLLSGTSYAAVGVMLGGLLVELAKIAPRYTILPHLGMFTFIASFALYWYRRPGPNYFQLDWGMALWPAAMNLVLLGLISWWGGGSWEAGDFSTYLYIHTALCLVLAHNSYLAKRQLAELRPDSLKFVTGLFFPNPFGVLSRIFRYLFNLPKPDSVPGLQLPQFIADRWYFRQEENTRWNLNHGLPEPLFAGRYRRWKAITKFSKELEEEVEKLKKEHPGAWEEHVKKFYAEENEKQRQLEELQAKFSKIQEEALAEAANMKS